MSRIELACCNECEHTDDEGGEGFRYCNNLASIHYGDCVEDFSCRCKFFKQIEPVVGQEIERRLEGME